MRRRAWSYIRFVSAGMLTWTVTQTSSPFAPKIGPGHAAITPVGIVHLHADGALQHGKILDWGPAGVKVMTRGGHYDVAYGDIVGAGIHKAALAAQPESLPRLPPSRLARSTRKSTG